MTLMTLMTPAITGNGLRKGSDNASGGEKSQNSSGELHLDQVCKRKYDMLTIDGTNEKQRGLEVRARVLVQSVRRGELRA